MAMKVDSDGHYYCEVCGHHAPPHGHGCACPRPQAQEEPEKPRERPQAASEPRPKTWPEPRPQEPETSGPFIRENPLVTLLQSIDTRLADIQEWLKN
jgi:hypothetical protein